MNGADPTPTCRAVFLDRDGTLNFDHGYTHRVADLQLFDHVVEGLQQLQKMGLMLIIVTNQSGVGRGYYTTEQMEQFNAALCDRLTEEGIHIQAVYHCTMHPDAVLKEHKGHSLRRKPQPGMLLEAATEWRIDLSASYMIGDKIDDVLAGHHAGCRSILITQDPEAVPGLSSPETVADAMAADLLQAARTIADWEAQASLHVMLPTQTRSDL